MDEGERGDDEDDAGRCRSDARAQPSTAFAAAERVGGTVAQAGVDITREREKKFRERPLLWLPETEGANGQIRLFKSKASAVRMRTKKCTLFGNTILLPMPTRCIAAMSP